MFRPDEHEIAWQVRHASNRWMVGQVRMCVWRYYIWGVQINQLSVPLIHVFLVVHTVVQHLNASQSRLLSQHHHRWERAEVTTDPGVVDRCKYVHGVDACMVYI